MIFSPWILTIRSLGRAAYTLTRFLTRWGEILGSELARKIEKCRTGLAVGLASGWVGWGRWDDFIKENDGLSSRSILHHITPIHQMREMVWKFVRRVVQLKVNGEILQGQKLFACVCYSSSASQLSPLSQGCSQFLRIFFRREISSSECRKWGEFYL